MEEAFFDKKDRRLRFKTNDPKLDVIRVRSFDVATFLFRSSNRWLLRGQMC